MSDLFSDAARERSAEVAPLAQRLRPVGLEEFVGQRHVLGEGSALRLAIEQDRLRSAIFYGPAGSGKTTLARIVAGVTGAAFEELSAVSATVAQVREVIARARERLGANGMRTILFLDEIHRFNKAQQDALLPHVEEGLITLIGATTENPYFEVNAPLLSRSTLFRLEPLGAEAVRTLLDRGLETEKATADEDALAHLVDRADGDARAALNALEVSIALAGEGRHVTMAEAEAALQARALRYERDEHYDVISAFIKSIRGSDPDAGLYWLARMLEAGEDARYIARRLVILASEDVGMADSNGLVVADAAARAVEFVGLPEAALNLAHCVVYLATAPKSNSTMAGLARASDDVRNRQAGAVPVHLRSIHPYQRNKLKEGGGYRYPHNEPSGFVRQEYRPPEIAGEIGTVDRRVYYRPSPHGREADIGR